MPGVECCQLQIVMRRGGSDERVGEAGVVGFRIGLAVAPAESLPGYWLVTASEDLEAWINAIERMARSVGAGTLVPTGSHTCVLTSRECADQMSRWLGNRVN